MNKKRQFLKFVIPSVVSMLVFNLYTMVDGIYVARFVGEHALSAVNISMPYINFIFAFSILFSVGTSTVVAIYRGENRLDEANRIFTINTIVLSISAILITLLAYFNLDTLASFLGASEITLPYAVSYTHLDVYKRQPYDTTKVKKVFKDVVYGPINDIANGKSDAAAWQKQLTDFWKELKANPVATK